MIERPFEVAIPSYKRAGMIRDKTLAVLDRCGVPPELVTVWVADDDELADYRATVPDPIAVRIGAPGLCACRNVIAEHYPTGTHLVQLDDDVDDVRQRLNDREHGPVADLPALWAEMFATTVSLGLRLWGVYPVVNPMFMKPKVRTGLWLITGPMFGVIACRDDPAATHVSIPGSGEKEDRERTLRYYCADGAVVRCDWVAVKTRYYRREGGIHAAGRTEATERAAVAYLLNGWPGLVTERADRKTGYPEVRLHDRRSAHPPS